jgi:chromosome segregation ATPase
MSEKPKFMTHERIMAGEEYVSYSDYLLLQRERDEARHDFEELAEVVRNLKVALMEVSKLTRTLKEERDEARNECDKLKKLLAADSERVDAYLGVCMERDEAREEINRYREKLDLLPISLDV